MGEWKSSLRIYFDAAKAALASAESHANASKVLIEGGHPGQAAALAIIGQEEAGKALFFTMIGFSLVPEEAIPRALSKLNHHQSKQQLALVGQVLAQMAPRIRAFADMISEDLTFGDLQPILSGLVPVVLDLVKAFVAERPDFDRRIADISVNGVFQDLKHRGLYVDLVDGKGLDSSTVTAGEAAAALADLEASTEGMRLFIQIAGLSDEGVKLTRAMLDPHLEQAKHSAL
jgi:AbiV family abortive infection protein